jgi:hypothetical protein
MLVFAASISALATQSGQRSLQHKFQRKYADIK